MRFAARFSARADRPTSSRPTSPAGPRSGGRPPRCWAPTAGLTEVFKSGLMDAAPPLIRWLGGLRAASAEAAAEHIVQAATDPALADVSGVFFSGRRPARTAPDSLAVDLRERLWDLSEGLTGASIPHWAGD